jgi:hypothetical protein
MTIQNTDLFLTTHTHTFDGVTWYMPEGVTFYHGNYGG